MRLKENELIFLFLRILVVARAMYNQGRGGMLIAVRI